MILNKFFKSLSVDEKIKDEIQSEMIIDNVVGFMSMTGGAGSSTIVANIAHILSNYNLMKKKKESLTDLVICVVDLNVINPIQYQLLGQEEPEKEFGLHNIFVSGPTKISSNMLRVSNTLSVVTASPNDDIYEYFDTTARNVSDMIEYLKDHFDIVILDIPNQPASPLCYEAIKMCSKVFVIWDESINIFRNTERLIDFFNKIKIRNKISHVIFNKKTKTPLDIEHIEELVKKLGLKLLGIIPYSQNIVNDSLSGKLYMEHGILKKDIKRAFMKVCSEITQVRLSNIIREENSNEDVDDQRRRLGIDVNN